MAQVRTTLGKVGFTPKGEYNVETEYTRLDLISCSGSSFIILKDGVIGIAPTADNVNYMLLAGRGEKLKFSDLTDEERDLLKLHFQDLEKEDIDLLQQPAIDAAKLANEATGKAIGAAGLANTNAGKADVSAKNATDAAGVAIVSAGNADEKAGLANTAAGLAADAASGANTAAQNANSAASDAKNVPLIQNGTFWLYDLDQKKYVDTGCPATGKSPKAIDGIWWQWNDEAGEYVSTNISASSDYELTKGKVETVLTGDITTHNHATQLAVILEDYVKKVVGKDLSTEDFTTTLKNKLAGLDNYNDAAVVSSIATINKRIDTLIGTSASEAIDTFREIEEFLQGITDTKTLAGLLSDLKTEITALIPTKLSQLANDNDTVKDANYQHTDNNYTNTEKDKLAKINFVPTLDHEPGEGDLTFADSNGEHIFMIGNQARVLDAEKGEYVFWQLYNISIENKAVWKKAGSGGDMQLTETVNITLSSNQAQPDSTLNGSVIHLVYGDNDTPMTWQNGSILTAEVPMNMTYRVVYPTIAGYATPETAEYIALAGNTRLISAMYNTTIMTVNVLSNQTDKSDLNNLQISISGSMTKILTYVGQPLSLKVPTGKEVTITPMQIEGYTPVAAVKKTPVTASDSASFTYTTEKVTIDVTADDNASVAGQILTVTKVSDSSVIYSGAAGSVVVKIPFGVQYKVSVNEKSGYKAVPDQTLTASEASRILAVVYEKIRASYITINQTITDPVTMITGDINGIIIQQIRTESHRVLGKYTASGQMTICRLNDANGNQYHDGTAAALTGTEGDVFMRLPRFFYKAEQVSTDVWKVGFAMQALDSNWKEWDGKDLIGVYEAYSNQSKAFSRSGVASTGGVSQATWKTHARARGTGYTLVKHKHQNILAFLFYGMYGNTNAQAVCGVGTNNYQKNTGQTNALGMTDTTVVNGNAMSINCWGLENWWGNKYEWVDNVIVCPVSDNGLWRITEDDNTTRDVQGATTSGYPKKMIIGDHLDTIVKEYGASDTTGFCDYQYTSGNGTTRVVRRSSNSASSNGGLVFVYANNDSSYTNAYIGSRLAFRGEIVEASSVTAFKAISITNNDSSSACCVPGYSNIVIDDFGNTKRAEELNKGDLILGFNFETGKEESSRIIAISKPMRDNKVTITTKYGIVLETTNDHPLWTNIGWACLEPENSEYKVGAKLQKLVVGLEIQLNIGVKDFIMSIEKTIIPETMQMYDFTTGLENFYASLSDGKGILCHNISCPS